jgi:preprotein translocase subunit SecD
LQDASIEYKGATLEDERLLVRLGSADAQLKAKEQISKVLGENYIVALNLASTTPAWLANLGAEPMN